MTDDSGTVIKQIGVKTDADVLLSTSLQYEKTINMNYEKKIYTGKNKTKRILIIGNKRIELCLNPRKLKECDVITDYSDIKLNEEFYLPVIYGVKQYKEYEKQLTALEYDEAESILNEKFNAYLGKLEENGVQIVDYRVNINILEDSYQMTGNINVTFKESTKISAEFDDNIINEQGD